MSLIGEETEILEIGINTFQAELILLDKEGWKMWPDNQAPNTNLNLEWFEFLSLWNVLFYRKKTL
ncbi:MAG: hypothetical protein ACFFG0_04495 [Candidatus Thorarchaeota archaeon]